MKKTILLMALFWGFLSIKSFATIIYVDSSNTGGFQDGSEWAAAYNSFQSGINAASAGDSIFVAKATYQTALNSSFVMKQGVKIFGGFLNTYTSFSQRNWQSNVTILKGNGRSVIINSNNGLTNAARLDGFTITGGTGINSGGGMSNFISSPIVINCIFSGNHTYDAPNLIGFQGKGGAIFNNQSSASFINCIISGNQSTSASNGGSGGGMYNDNANPILTNVQFLNNTCVFGLVTGSGSGGGMYNNNSSPVISQCTFSGGSALIGGGIYNNGTSAPQIDSTIFSNNISTRDGGGMYNAYQSAPNLTNCTFLMNKTGGNYSGGGIYNYNASSVSRINRCTFNNNSSRYGGAIYNSGTNPDIRKTVFVGNKATLGGGSIYNFYSSPFIQKCSFSSDTTLKGGGIYNDNSSPLITNCLFSKNLVDSFGGAIYNLQSLPQVINCSMSNNKATFGGGAIYNAGNSAPNIVNSILWGNNSGILNDGSSTAAASYCLIQGYIASATYHNIAGTTNPLFADTSAGNYRLQNGSPCIDLGSNSADTTTTDLDGNVRIIGSSIDMGAYEFGNVPLDLQFLSFSAKLQSNNNVLLQWQISSDKSDEHGNIELQRSNDGRHYTTIYNAAVSGDGANKFSFTDEHPQSTNFYRLGLSNENGAFRFSNTIFIRLAVAKSASSVYPNPAKENITIAIGTEGLLKSTVIITDLSGKFVSKTLITKNLQTISLSGLNTGLYLLKMESGEVFKIEKR